MGDHRRGNVENGCCAVSANRPQVSITIGAWRYELTLPGVSDSRKGLTRINAIISRAGTQALAAFSKGAGDGEALSLAGMVALLGQLNDSELAFFTGMFADATVVHSDTIHAQLSKRGVDTHFDGLLGNALAQLVQWLAFCLFETYSPFLSEVKQPMAEMLAHYMPTAPKETPGASASTSPTASTGGSGG